MVTVYTLTSCPACKKAKEWLKQHDMPFKEIRVKKNTLSAEEIKHFLSLTDNGTEDLMSTRSQTYKNLRNEVEEKYTLRELIEVIRQNPRMLRCPLIVEKNKLIIGFKEEDIRCLIPKNIRKIELLPFLTHEHAIVEC